MKFDRISWWCLVLSAVILAAAWSIYEAKREFPKSLCDAPEIIALPSRPTQILAIKLKSLTIIEALTRYAAEEPLAVHVAIEWRRKKAEAVAGGLDPEIIQLMVLDPNLMDKVLQAETLLRELD